MKLKEMESNAVKRARGTGRLLWGKKRKQFDLCILSERRVRSILNPDKMEERSVFKKILKYI